MEFSALQIAQFLDGTIEGNPEVTVSNFSKIEEGQPGTLSFLSNPKYSSYIYDCKSSIILVNKDLVLEKEITNTLIRVNNAYESLAKLMNLVEQFQAKKTGISSLSEISQDVEIGNDCYIAPFVHVGDKVKIGDNCQIFANCNIGDKVKIGNNVLIYPGVTIYKECEIGDNCILHAGVVIGSDGFGFAPKKDGSYDKIPQVGNVKLGKNVEIGANTVVDRATMGSTVIENGVKLDNLVQIAHNVVVGSNTVIAAQTGIAGSTKVGSNCVFGGQVGMAGHIEIANRTTVGAQSGISNTIKGEGQVVMGYTAIPIGNFRRSHIVYKNLPELQKTLFELLKRIEKLEKAE